MSDIEYRLQVTIPGFRQPVVCGIQTGQETDQRTALPPISVNVDSPPGSDNSRERLQVATDEAELMAAQLLELFLRHPLTEAMRPRIEAVKRLLEPQEHADGSVLISSSQQLGQARARLAKMPSELHDCGASESVPELQALMAEFVQYVQRVVHLTREVERYHVQGVMEYARLQEDILTDLESPNIDSASNPSTCSVEPSISIISLSALDSLVSQAEDLEISDDEVDMPPQNISIGELAFRDLLADADTLGIRHDPSALQQMSSVRIGQWEGGKSPFSTSEAQFKEFSELLSTELKGMDF